MNWECKQNRRFSKKERDLIYSGYIRQGEYGPMAEFRINRKDTLWGFTIDTFKLLRIPILGGNLPIGARLNLQKLRILRFSKRGEASLYRIDAGYLNEWQQRSKRYLTYIECESIKSICAIASCYGFSACIRLADTEEAKTVFPDLKRYLGDMVFIPLVSSTVMAGDTLDPHKVSLVTLAKRGESNAIHLKPYDDGDV